jgi:hypothetical protein
LAVLAGCASEPPPKKVEQPKVDPVTEAWYPKSVSDLAALNHRGEDLFRKGERDQAGTVVTEGQELQGKLLAAPKPTLEAMEVSSDLDDLYARILLANNNVGWARLVYQKNVVRWRVWKPQTAETEKRRKQAEAGIKECDRRL